MRALLLGALLLTACGAAPPPPSATPPEDPGVLLPPASYPGDFLTRQHLTGSYGARSVSFDAVVQKRGDELLMIGMTPFGSKAFVLRQAGAEVTFQRYVDVALPFPPRYILLDVHRALLTWLAPAGAALADGMHERASGGQAGEILRERWAGGRLVERRYRRAEGTPAGEIVITYEGGMGPDRTPPKCIVFVNGWFGYRLEINTETWEPLAASAARAEPAPSSGR